MSKSSIRYSFAMYFAYLTTTIILISIMIYVIYKCSQDGFPMKSDLATLGLGVLLTFVWYTVLNAVHDDRTSVYKYLKQKHHFKK